MLKKTHTNTVAARLVAAGCAWILGCAGGHGAWAQALEGTELERLEVTMGYQPSSETQIRSQCSALGATSMASAYTLNIPEMAQRGDLLSEWIPLTLPGWSCKRIMGIGGTAPGDLPPYAPECNNLSSKCNADGYMTKLRHWLRGNIPNAQVYDKVVSDGEAYHVIRRSDWVPPHPMAGLGFIVKWEADVMGTPLTRVIGPGYPENLSPAFLHNYAPTADAIHPSQGPFNNNNYLVTDARVSYRMVLLDANTEAIYNSDGNAFTLTQAFSLGGDHCGWGVFLPCELNYSSFSNAFFEYTALLNLRRIMPTCSTDNVLVQFPPLSVTQFAQDNAANGLTAFALELKNCSSALRNNVVYRLSAAPSGPPSPDPGNGLIPLDPMESTASGVDVQILDDNQAALALDTFHTAYTWGGPGSPQVTHLHIPLYAHVRRRGSTPVTGGEFKAAATFVMQYP